MCHQEEMEVGKALLVGIYQRAFLYLWADVLGGGTEGGMGEGGGRRMQVVFVVNSFLCD